MKNINYDLIKLLHMKLDEIHRLEQFYMNDADKAQCHSLDALQKILEDAKKHRDKLINEISMRINAKIFD